MSLSLLALAQAVSWRMGRISHKKRHHGVVAEVAAGAAEVFAEANRFCADYLLRIASVDGQDVTTSIMTSSAVTDCISLMTSADTVMIAGGVNLVERAIDPTLVEAVRSLPSRELSATASRRREVRRFRR
jgi:hypothetical protein